MMQQRSFIVTLFVITIIVAARLYYVGAFATPLPYWDQWDAEGDFLLRPWIEGRLRLRELWQPHNEHRIFPTRVLSLLIFNVTGTWNNLIEARINVLLAACIPAILLGFLLRQRALSGIRWLVLIAVIAQFALPFSFENVLVGFQSQFYFLIIFTLTALILAVQYPQRAWAMAVIVLLCVLSVLTMASGLLTPISVAGVYALHACVQRQVGGLRAILMVALTGVAVWGYLLLPQIPANQMYRAENLSDLFGAIGYILSWPVIGNRFAGLILWLPVIATVPWLLFKKNLTRADMLMAGCVFWSLMQALAIAYGRGQGLTEVASRYTELFSLGLIGNAWFAARFIEQSSRRPVGWVMAAFFVVLVGGHTKHYGEDMHDIRRNHRLSLKQEQNVRRYLRTNDPSALVQPKFEIPYPDPVRLQGLLDDPVIRRILPVDPGE